MDDTTYIDIFASGSRGNAALATLSDTRILVDIGISFSRLSKGLAERDCSLEELDAVFITHEHSDHVRGLERMLSVSPDTPLFMSGGTRDALRDTLKGANVTILEAGGTTCIKGEDISTYRLAHDAAQPMGLRLQSSVAAIGFSTDLGHWTDEVAHSMSDVDLLLLEANYDPRLLETGPYPHFLKRRIGGSRGHLSNEQAQSLLDRVAHDELQHVVLTHMSETNNESLMAESLMAEVLVGVPASISTAFQRQLTPRIHLRPRQRHVEPSQTSLF